MSLRPQPIDPIPEETVRVARASFPRPSPYMRMRDELGTVYRDAAFTPLFPAKGQPAESPWRLALVLVFQYAEGLSARQAADAVRARIDGKYALSLALTDPGFDASVLSEFRARLVAGSAEQALLDLMLDRFKAKGLLKARGRQRTDSTAVMAAIRTLNRLECVGETPRHALNSLAVAAPDWLRPHLDPAWAERYGPRFDEYRLPKGEDARQRLAEQVGADGLRLLQAVYVAASPAWLRDLPAVAVLRRVWVQQYHAPDAAGGVRWRGKEDLPPAARMINSPHDPEARYPDKRSASWIGYKVQLTETCDPDRPHLITNVETTPATAPDCEQLPTIHRALARKGLLPREHLVDAGYPDAAILADSQQGHGVAVIGPVPPNVQWQALAHEGFDVTCFGIDWEGQTATCPAGQRNATWSTSNDRHGNQMIHIQFARGVPGLSPSSLVHDRARRSPPDRSPEGAASRPPRRTAVPGDPGVHRPLSSPGRRRGDDLPRSPRLRLAPRPLCRLSEDPPATHSRRRGAQRYPCRPLVCRRAFRADAPGALPGALTSGRMNPRDFASSIDYSPGGLK